jgi:hypothetical protein
MRIGGAHRRRWALRGMVIAGSGLLVAAWGPVGTALADPCPLLDPVCVIETVDDTVDQTVDIAKDTVNDTVDKVRKTVEDVTDPGGNPGPGPGGGGGGNGGADDRGGHGSNPRDPVSRPTQPTTPVVAPTAGSGSTIVVATVHDTEPTTEAGAPTILAHGLPAALREVAVGLALPLLLLAGIVVGFTAIQNRLDRRDPKLALAPLAADVVRFA